MRLGQSFTRALTQVSPDERWFVTGGADGQLELWDNWNGNHVRSFAGHRGTVLSTCFATSGSTLLSYAQDQTIRWWDVASGAQVGLRVVPEDTRYVAFSPDATLYATTERSGLITVR